jgi:hypothetical protein
MMLYTVPEKEITSPVNGTVEEADNNISLSPALISVPSGNLSPKFCELGNLTIPHTELELVPVEANEPVVGE